MVEILGMKTELSKRARFLNWWRIEGKIELTAGVIAMVIMLAFWNNFLVQGIVMVIGALWGYGKIYFKRHQWAFLLLISTWVLTKGIANIFVYFRS